MYRETDLINTRIRSFLWESKITIMKIPKSHPRYESLTYRHKLLDGFRRGYVAGAGLIAHGRGEAFDYLIGEKTTEQAMKAEKVAVGMLLLSKNPVISVNGNVAALVPKGIVRLSRLINAKIEVNLFYRTLKREKLIKNVLMKNGAKVVLGVGKNNSERIPDVDSMRGKVDKGGIWAADTILIPLEDGDRAEALRKIGKNIIAIDLNPLSRTSQSATIAIVDNIVRAIPNMLEFAKEMKKRDRKDIEELIENFKNKKNLNTIIKDMAV